MTKQKTRMEKPQPHLDDDAPAVVVQQRDPRLCACVDVQRRYDGDGLVEQRDGTNYYCCAVCGKLYV